MPRYIEQVEILASPQAVWAVLSDVQGWRKWTPTVELVRILSRPGAPAGAGSSFGVGSEAWVKQPRLPGARWRVTVFEPASSFTWQSQAPGVRTVAAHLLYPYPRGAAEPRGTEVTLELRQNGPLAWLAGLLLGRLTRRYLALEAAGLKVYCEALAGTR
ncbi:SRPBCC family protein [Kitasatospora sp. NBC_01250]|uniref:SRPBCC family protein n=1 Tax=unclassified Kitasatospora TaxID=2633591 RepID=UPI002E0D52B8|nr:MULTISPECIES: SRPBCC family protein [unclassified Kitasatospora]WSJ69770.1 SRPBCC family protein [Kitasatospora sp. NBC_01302]